MSNWENLKYELQKEAELVFQATGGVIVVTPGDDAQTKLVIVSRTRLLKVIHIPDKGVVRWDTEKEYAFERIPEQATELAKSLIRMVMR